MDITWPFLITKIEREKSVKNICSRLSIWKCLKKLHENLLFHFVIGLINTVSLGCLLRVSL